VYSNLLVTADTERTDSVASLAVDGGLTTQLLEHFRCTSESVTGFTDGDIQYKFLDAQLAHGVRALVFGVRHDDVAGCAVVDFSD